MKRALAVLALLGVMAIPAAALAQSPSPRLEPTLGTRAEGIEFTWSLDGDGGTVSPMDDGRERTVVYLPWGTLELIGPADGLTEVSWFGEADDAAEWGAVLDRFAPGQRDAVIGLLVDIASQSQGATFVLADRTLQVSDMRAIDGGVIELRIKAGTAAVDVSPAPSPASSLVTY